MSPYKETRLSSGRCVWFCSIAALWGSKHSRLSETYYPREAANRQLKYDTFTHRANTREGYIFLNKLPRGQVETYTPLIHPSSAFRLQFGKIYLLGN